MRITIKVMHENKMSVRHVDVQKDVLKEGSKAIESAIEEISPKVVAKKKK